MVLLDLSHGFHLVYPVYLTHFYKFNKIYYLSIKRASIHPTTRSHKTDKHSNYSSKKFTSYSSKSLLPPHIGGILGQSHQIILQPCLFIYLFIFIGKRNLEMKIHCVKPQILTHINKVPTMPIYKAPILLLYYYYYYFLISKFYYFICWWSRTTP